jgi:uncharacterized protein (DUF2342 family)
MATQLQGTVSPSSADTRPAASAVSGTRVNVDSSMIATGWLKSSVARPRGSRASAWTPSDSRYVYFAFRDVQDLLISETGELNLLSLFSMAAAGNLPPASGREHMTLG